MEATTQETSPIEQAGDDDRSAARASVPPRTSELPVSAFGLAARLAQGVTYFGQIFLSYLIQYVLERLLEHDDSLLPPAKRAASVEVEGPSLERRAAERAVPSWLAKRAEALHIKNSRRLLRAILKLRGVFIKLGQVLSIMGGFLPRAYTKELEQLQDQVPPQPFAGIRRSIFESLGVNPEELFERFEEVPVAAASLGQVHVAYLKEGDKVAVKVLYPGIRAVIDVDMRVVRWAIAIYQKFVPVQGLERVHDALADLLKRETDYLHEGACMERMAKNFEGQNDILFPTVFWQHTSSDVLTMSFMDGIRIGKVDELRANNIDPSAVATRLIESFYKQIFVDRFFHADPHPGNFLVQAGRSPRRPKIVVLDFGAISEVQGPLIEGFLEVIGGLVENDSEMLLRGFFAMGFASEEANRDLLRRTVEHYFQKLLKLKDRTPRALMKANQHDLEALIDPELERAELRELMGSISYPEDWFYLERASVIAFWLVAQLDPDMDALKVGYPYVLPLLGNRSNKVPAAEPS